MISYPAVSAEPVQAIWPFLAEPGRWRRWTPHLPGAVGLGGPQVQAGGRSLANLARVAGN